MTTTGATNNMTKPGKHIGKRKSKTSAQRSQERAATNGLFTKSSQQSAERDPLSQPSLGEHAMFFDHLVELVPARYYHDLDADRINTKYMKKTDRLAAKAAFSKQHKQNKRDKLDPDKQQSTLEVQKQLAAGGAAQQATPKTGAPALAHPSAKAATTPKPALSRQPDQPKNSNHPALQINLDSAPRALLQERLAAKVAVMRNARHAQDRAASLAAANKFRATTAGSKLKGAKRKRDVSSGGRAAAEVGSGNLRKGPKQPKLSDADFRRQLAEVDQVLSSGKKPPGSRPRPVADDATVTQLTFGQLEIGQAESQMTGRRKGKSKKDSKATLLAKAEARQAASTAAATEPLSIGQGQAQKDGHIWGAAMKRARGEKVLDDPTRLRRSLKKDAKAADKRRGAWAQRTADQVRSQSDRQKQREANLSARATGKAERRKAKREKKLMRPGFEGRRSTTIGS